MTREELFRALGEVRMDQVEAAETVKKQIHPWRRVGVLAACLAVIATVAAAPAIRGQPQWQSIIYSFHPAVEKETGGDAGGSAGAGGLDGSSYWTDTPNRPAYPDYSTGAEIGELAGPGNNAGMMGLASCAAWLSPEELFAQDTAIFRGIVRELQYFSVQLDALRNVPTYYTRAIVEVTDSIRGSQKTGETCSLLWLGAKGYLSTSLSGPLEELDVGGEAIFMPISTDQDTGWKEGDSYFCYADLAEFYLGEGQRYVFADTAEGLAFDRGVYEEIGPAETLDDVAVYIREMTGRDAAGEERVQSGKVVPILPDEEESDPGGYVFVEGVEQTQPASEPVVPQTEPSRTVSAGESANGPAGARELPGGAYAGDETGS